MTLIEVMIALMLFTVGLLAVAALQGASIDAEVQAQRSMHHSAAAGGQLEQILSMAYDDERLADPDRGYHPEEPDHGPFAIDAAGGTMEWEVQDDFPAPRFKRITVTVRWQNRGGAMRSFSYDYVKTKDVRS